MSCDVESKWGQFILRVYCDVIHNNLDLLPLQVGALLCTGIEVHLSYILHYIGMCAVQARIRMRMNMLILLSTPLFFVCVCE